MFIYNRRLGALIIASLLLGASSLISAFGAIGGGCYKNSIALYPLIFLSWSFFFLLFRLVDLKFLRVPFVGAVMTVFIFAYLNMQNLADKAGMSAFTVGSNLFGFIFSYLAITASSKTFKTFFFLLLLATFSRLALLAFIIASMSRKPMSILYALSAIGLVYYLYVTFGMWGIEGFKWVFRTSDSGRTEKIKMAINAFLDSDGWHLMFGHGGGMYGIVAEQVKDQYAHNVVTQFLVEFGLVGVVVIVLFFVFLRRLVGLGPVLVILICSFGETVFENYVVLALLPFLVFLPLHPGGSYASLRNFWDERSAPLHKTLTRK